MIFNIDNYKGKYVMHCQSEKEAKDFLKYLNNIGRRQSDGEKYSEDNLWWDYEGKTCYDFNTGEYSDIKYYIAERYKILEWSDFMPKNFTKSNLKTGDIILRRNGEVEIVCLETNSLIARTGFGGMLSKIKEDLTSEKSDWDIVAVRRPLEPNDCQFNAFQFGFGELVYNRNNEIVEMTLEEICEALGKNIKIVKGY